MFEAMALRSRTFTSIAERKSYTHSGTYYMTQRATKKQNQQPSTPNILSYYRPECSEQEYLDSSVEYWLHV